MTTWAELVVAALALGGVSEATSYGEPSLKVGKALLTRYRTADDSIVLKSVDVNERDILLGRSPNIFFLEDHYISYEIVLANLGPAKIDQIMPFIARTWVKLTPQRTRR